MYQVWWLGYLRKNERAPSQPIVRVIFRPVGADGNVDLAQPFVEEDIGLAELGQVRLGTRWQGRSCIADVALKKLQATVSFEPEGWTYASFLPQSKRKLQVDGEPPIVSPYPHELYPPGYRQDRTFLLRFEIHSSEPSGPRDGFEGSRRYLYIPCVEFLRRMFGRSSYVSRVLAAYSLFGIRGAMHRLIGPPPEWLHPDRWWVTLRRRCYNGDRVFLAHLLHDTRARDAVLKMWARFEAERDGLGADTQPAFVAIGPWSGGMAMMDVAGMPSIDDRSFLALRLDGCTDPEGPAIDAYRENDGRAIKGEESDAALPNSGFPRFDSDPDDDEGAADLEHQNEPGRRAPTRQVFDDAFATIGDPRFVEAPEPAETRTSGGIHVDQAAIRRLANGEGFSSEAEVGTSSIVAASDPGERESVVSEGFLSDMPRAIHRVLSEVSGTDEPPKFYTARNNFEPSRRPLSVRLVPFGADETLDGEEPLPNQIRRWPTVRGRPRKAVALLAKAPHDDSDRQFCVVEIEPDPPPASAGPGEASEGRRYKGLVFLVDDEADAIRCVRTLLSGIRYVKGVMDGLKGTESYPDEAATFVHSQPKGERDDRYPYETAATNALNHVRHLIETA